MSVPARLIVDGQQRLTSLYAVFRGKKVLDEDYQRTADRDRLSAARREVRGGRCGDPQRPGMDCQHLRPLGVGQFELPDGQRLPQAAWSQGAVDRGRRRAISHNLDRLFDLQKYPFTALEIAPTVDEEQVADIFVRINSEGVKLNQADFILTLLSVFWDEGRAALETFCRLSAEAADARRPCLAVQPLHRAGPGPARCASRSRSVSTADASRASTRCCAARTSRRGSSRRSAAMPVRGAAGRAGEVLDLTTGTSSCQRPDRGGLPQREMISSQNALLYAYAIYLIGRESASGCRNIGCRS